MNTPRAITYKDFMNSIVDTLWNDNVQYNSALTSMRVVIKSCTALAREYNTSLPSVQAAATYEIKHQLAHTQRFNRKVVSTLMKCRSAGLPFTDFVDYLTTMQGGEYDELANCQYNWQHGKSNPSPKLLKCTVTADSPLVHPLVDPVPYQIVVMVARIDLFIRIL